MAHCRARRHRADYTCWACDDVALGRHAVGTMSANATRIQSPGAIFSTTEEGALSLADHSRRDAKSRSIFRSFITIRAHRKLLKQPSTGLQWRR